MSHTIATSAANPLWVFEENYRLLTRLLPEPRVGVRHGFALNPGREDLELELLERFKFTSSLGVRHFFSSGGRLLPDLSMTVRIYHDARVAEVIAYQECSRLPPRYEIDESSPFQRDEKHQTNRLLYELLRRYAARQRVDIADILNP